MASSKARRARRRRSDWPVGQSLKAGGRSWSDLASPSELPRFRSSLDPFAAETTTKRQRDIARREAQKAQARFWKGGRGEISPLSAKSPLRVLKRVNPLAQSRILAKQIVPAGVRFVNPRRVWACFKRKARREVLFALDLAGHRGSGPGARRPDGKMYRRTEDSNYGC